MNSHHVATLHRRTEVSPSRLALLGTAPNFTTINGTTMLKNYPASLQNYPVKNPLPVQNPSPAPVVDPKADPYERAYFTAISLQYLPGCRNRNIAHMLLPNYKALPRGQCVSWPHGDDEWSLMLQLLTSIGAKIDHSKKWHSKRKPIHVLPLTKEEKDGLIVFYQLDNVRVHPAMQSLFGSLIGQALVAQLEDFVTKYGNYLSSLLTSFSLFVPPETKSEKTLKPKNPKTA